MSHTIADGFAMLEAAHANNRVVQIGSQACEFRRSAPRPASSNRGGGALSATWNSSSSPWDATIPTVRGSILPPVSRRRRSIDTWPQRPPQNPVRSCALRALALLGVNTVRAWAGPDGAPAQRHALHAGMERAAAIRPRARRIFRFNDGRNMPDVHLVLFVTTACRSTCGLDLVLAEFRNGAFSTAPRHLEASAANCAHSAIRHGHPPSYTPADSRPKMRDQYVRQCGAEHVIPPGKEALREAAVFQSTTGTTSVRTCGTFFQAVKNSRHCHRGRGIWKSRRHRLPHGERSYFAEAGVLGQRLA